MALSNWQVFGLGFFIGVNFGIVILAIFIANKKLDDEIDEVLGRE